MRKKLTLTLQPDVIDKAKAYAEENGTSVSAIVEAHLSGLDGVRANPAIADVNTILEQAVQDVNAVLHRS